MLYGVRADLAQVALTPAFALKMGVPLAVAACGLPVILRLAQPGARRSAAVAGLWLPVLLLWAWAVAELAQAPVWKGSTNQVKAGLAEDLTMTLPKGQLKKLAASMTMNPQLVAPIAKGDVIGKVEVKLDDKVVHSADLIALDAVEEGGIFRRMWDSIRLFFYSLFN